MNGNVINFTTAKKTKLHGMVSSKWTTKDKITQYKGLINLYERDRKIMISDAAVMTKRLHREWKVLQKDVVTDRQKLDNAIRGNRQQLRNTLSEKKDLQLAYQNSPPEKVVECVHQLSFTTRKALDKLRYQRKLKSQQLIDLKLEQALLEDRLKYADYGKLDQEKKAQIITGKVQDAILKQEAAVAIRHIYTEIYDIMKKDSIYFDVMLTSIQNDGLNQSRCILNATRLGQLATEYLDDRMQEYQCLEKIILQDMATRKRDLTIMEEQVANAVQSINQVLRKESDITFCHITIKETKAMQQFRQDLNKIEQTLTFLKTTTFVPTFEQIYPCLVEQRRQKKRLKRFAKRCETGRDIIMNKLNHAELMKDVLKNTMVDTTMEYKLRKKELIDNQKEVIKIINANEKVLRKKYNIIGNIKIGLRQLDNNCLLLTEKKKGGSPTSSAANLEPSITTQDDIEDDSKFLQSLISKVSYLMSSYQEKSDTDTPKLHESYKMFETMMANRCLLTTDDTKKLSDLSLLQGLYVEASTCLTRDDIKKQSQEIVAANTKNDDLIPLFAPKKRKRKFKF